MSLLLRLFAARTLRQIGICLSTFLLFQAIFQAFSNGSVVCLAADFQSDVWFIKNARIITAPGTELDAANLLIRDGRIVAAGKDVVAPPDAQLIEAENLFVYPGFLDAGTTTLLDSKKPIPVAEATDPEFARQALAATRNSHRKGLTPELQVQDYLKLDKGIIEKRRMFGFTALHILPRERLANGQSVLVSTAGLPLRDIILPGAELSSFQLFAMGGDGYPSTLMGGTAHLRQAFLDARRHANHGKLFDMNDSAGIERPPVDPAWDALNHVVEQKQAVFIAQSRDDIHRALDFAEAEGLKPVIWGGHDAAECLDRLKSTQSSVILQVDYGNEPKIELTKPSDKLQPEIKEPERVQQDKLDRWKKQVATAARLAEADIPFAIGSQGIDNPADLLKSLRSMIAEGLPRDAALAAITQNSAKLLNADALLGTLEPGKLAHVVILTGPFDHEKSQVRFVFVDRQKFEYNPDAKPIPADMPATPAIDLAGEWNLVIEAADGKVTGTLSLRQTGGKLTGEFESSQGNGKVGDVKVTDKSWSFVVTIGAGDRDVLLKFSGEPVEGDHKRWSGELKSAFGAATKWSAVRSPEKAPDAPANPVELTIETDDEKKKENVAANAVDADKPGEFPTELQSDRLKRSVQTGGNLLIRNATVITGRGETFEATSILVKGGKIVAIGPNLEADANMTVIDATGRFIMPGIIDTHSHIMITQGINEGTQSIVPEVRVKDVVWTDDASEYRALAGGVTTARLLHGSANVIGGQDAVVKLKYGRTAHEHILHDAPQGVKFALGENVKFRTQRFPNTRMGVEATLNRAFLEAIDYRRQWMRYEQKVAAAPDMADKLLPPRRDLRLEALKDIVDHQKFIHSHCYRADEILMLLRVASGLGIRVWSLQHVLEGYKVAPEIVAHGASCSTFADWWAYKVEAFDAIPHNAALLQEAGANVVVKSDDWELIRHLYQEAAKTVRYGNMSPDNAIAAITYHPAKELGLDSRMGSIEVGKDADLAIFSGHPLNGFSRCEQTIIDGEIYFTRAEQPSIMLTDAMERSGKPSPLVFPASEIRARELDIAPADNGSYALVGATIHPVDGPDLPAATLVIADGKIQAVGVDMTIPDTATKIDLAGLHLYPGMIDAGTTLGLIEIGKVRETHDYGESGDYQPDLRAGVAINPDSELIPVARAGGITTMLARPTGGVISGQASLVQLHGWTVPEMVLNFEAGLQIQWPGGDRAKAVTKQLKELFEQARFYETFREEAKAAGQPGPIADPRLDALLPYLSGERPVFIEADSRKKIAEALIFAEEEKLKLILTDGADAWKLAAELKKRDIPVILGPVMRKPVENYDPFDAPYANAGRLHAAGVRFCIRSDSASNSRNAPFEAAMAAAYGLPEDAALEAVTLAPARILGIDQQVGSLTAGKSANILITDGSPLQPITQIKAVFIGGKPYAPESRQTRFYEKYRARLKTQPVAPTAEVGAN